ncbi:alpha/beta fold hydrolase [Fructilactobacillus florum]|uniref:AB hydrolase-1 domain-containing protein n=1 Tax=Fructilactobacillus florum DSM 22689 = JCM 16035 TaxID=1423745 RepID=A0A0R2CMV2_9LACO|nr:alpha/beta hydrolase [Fructilactobacillus florum]KRM91284.1 hypothetical protein FC87_GL001004 [Fructilactobacillus florum DSM 22689 = JCM 16035]
MKFYTNDRIEIAYDDFGNSTQTPVVILSGIGAYKEYWQATIQALVAKNYRVINIDARNQGQSEHTRKGLRITRHAMDLRELLIKLHVKHPILMGNSMGAATMFAYVSLFGEQEVAALVDVDQSPKMINDDQWQYGFTDLHWDDFHMRLRQPLGKPTYHNFDDQLFAKLQTLKQQYPYDAELNYPLLLDHATQDWRDVVTSLQKPLLVVTGDHSPFFPVAIGNVMEQMNPLVQATTIMNAGHLVMAEQPCQFNQTLLSFLATVGAA